MSCLIKSACCVNKDACINTKLVRVCMTILHLYMSVCIDNVYMSDECICVSQEIMLGITLHLTDRTSQGWHGTGTALHLVFPLLTSVSLSLPFPLSFFWSSSFSFLCTVWQHVFPNAPQSSAGTGKQTNKLVFVRTPLYQTYGSVAYVSFIRGPTFQQRKKA